MKTFNSWDPEEYRKKFILFTWLIVVVFSIICLRLWYMQVINGEKFKELSENNRIRLEALPPYRGEIYDRNGVLVVDNRPSFNLCVASENIRDEGNLILNLSRLIQLDSSQLRNRINDIQNYPLFKPIGIKRDLGWNELSLMEMHKLDLPGVVIQTEPIRNYLFGKFASHLIGYVGEINERELKSGKFPNSRMGDFIGKSGIERKWQRYLDGIRGGRQIEVDVLGRSSRILREIKPHPGNSLFITIDYRLQKVAEELLTGKAGSIIAMNPKNGEILAMVSAPSFDPNAFARGITLEEWKSLINNPLHPLENKALQGQYPPGSVFKIVTAAAALEEEVISPYDRIFCPGWHKCGNRIYRCWIKRGHGNMDIHKALVQSCDTFFYQMGQKLGIDRLARYARGFGFGMPTGINFRDEKAGLIPISRWKLKKYGIPWQEGETLSCAIGQGFVLATPLQIVVAISAIANGGDIYRPQIVSKIKDTNGKIIKEFPPIKVKSLPISKENLRIIKEALFGVVNQPRGTGEAAQSNRVDICGKTGTAQVIRSDLDKGQDEKDVPYLHRDHAWFAAFAPKEDSEIAVVVLVEHGGYGGITSAPMAKAIIEEYFRTRGNT